MKPLSPRIAAILAIAILAAVAYLWYNELIPFFKQTREELRLSMEAERTGATEFVIRLRIENIGDIPVRIEAISLNDTSIQIGAGGGSGNMGEYPVLINFVEGSEELEPGESARADIWIHGPISMQRVDIVIHTASGRTYTANVTLPP